MPPMPYPVTRNASILAVEDMFNTKEARLGLLSAFSSISDLDAGGDQRLIKRVRDACEDEAETAVNKMIETIGQATIDDKKVKDDWEDSGIIQRPDPKDAGLHHLDAHWFGRHTGRKNAFFRRYHGAPAVHFQRGYVRALKLAMAETRYFVPIHVIWVCGSPTFEISVSTASRDEGLAAVVVVMSTPETRFALAHVDHGKDDDVKEDHFVYGQRAVSKEPEEGEDRVPEVPKDTDQNGTFVIHKPNLRQDPIEAL